jgi:hypothetical protein
MSPLAADVATWEYSTDGGTNWTTGTGTSFTLAEGAYAANAVQVRQTDVAGNTSAAASNAAAITIDATVAAPSFALNADTGSNGSDGITNNGQVDVTLAADVATWEYSTDGGTNWTTGTGNSFTLAEGAYAANAVQVRQTDVAGNTSAAASNAAAITIDATVAAPSFALNADTGSNGSDGITNNGQVDVTLAADVATWEYSTDGGTNWTTGTGTSFTLAEGAYAANAVQVRQTDVAGNTSAAASNAAEIVIDQTVDSAPPASLTVGGSADINVANADIAFTVSGMDADATGVVTFSDGVNPDVVVDVSAGNGPLTANLSTLSGTITTTLNITDTAGNTATATGNSVYTTLQAAVTAATAGQSIFISDGTYDLGTSTLNIDKSLTIEGESEAGVIIDGSGIDGYGIFVTADDTSLSNFTLNGPTAGGASGNYGLKIQPDSGDPSDRISNIDIENVTVQGSARSEIDLNGVNGATLTNVTADGQGTGGVGIAITDSANITLHNIETTGNTWGSVALYPTNTYYDQQVDNIEFTGTYTHNEAIGIYVDDASATQDLGDVTFPSNFPDSGASAWSVTNDAFRGGLGDSDHFTFFFATKAEAVAFAQSIQDDATGAAVDNTRSVVHAPDGSLVVEAGLSIQAAVDAADPSDTITVGTGTYVEQVVIDGKDGLTLQEDTGADVTIEAPTTLVSTGNSPTSGRDINGLVTVKNADGVTIQGITVDGLELGTNIAGATNPTMAGIAYIDASGTIDGVEVTGIRESDAMFGMQRGLGIYVTNSDPSSGDGTTTPNTTDTLKSIEIKNTTVENFQKGGIVVSYADVNIHDNTVTGIGGTDWTAQNGIQVSGSTGAIEDNTVTDIGYTGTNWSASGILTYYNNELLIDGNTVTGSGSTHLVLGIATINSVGGAVTHNTISNVAWGVDAEDYSSAYGWADALIPGAAPYDYSSNTLSGIGENGLWFQPDSSSTDAFNVTGTTGDDVIYGAAADDSLDGGAGNDAIDGGTGADSMSGGAGDDTIDGGTGTDTAVYAAGATIAIDASGNWTVTDAGGTDTLTGVEKVTIDSTTYLLVDKAGANVGGYQTLQSAIDAASGGETILVAPGAYTESANYNPADNTNSGSNPLGLLVNKSVTIQGVDADGVAITDASATEATITASVQSNWGTSFFVTAPDVTIIGLEFDAAISGGIVNKAIEVVENNFTLAHSVVGSVSGDIGSTIYINDDIATSDPGFISDIASFNIHDNILNGDFVLTNGPGMNLPTTSFVLADNDFVRNPGSTDDWNWGVIITGQDDAVAWRPASLGGPLEATGNNFSSGYTTDRLLYVRDDNAAKLPDAQFVEDFIANNGILTYAYATDPSGVPSAVDLGTTYGFVLALSAGNASGYANAGDTLIVKTDGSPVTETIVTDDLTVDARSANLDLELGGGVITLSLDGSQNVDVTGNALANSITGNSGDNTITGVGGNDSIDGGDGTDTVILAGNRADYTITLSGTTYTVVDNRGGSPDGTDTVTNVENFQFVDGTFTAGGTLDVTAPTATLAYGTHDGTLKAGDTVDLVVTFSEVVTVAGGSPSLILDTGATATLTGSTTNTLTLTFTYTVAAGENSADLAVTSFNLNDATIKDAQGNDADLSGAVGNPADTLVVDTTAPTLTISDDETGVANIAGSDVVYTFQFSEAVSGFDADDVTVTNGTKGTFTAVDAYTYTLAVTPDADEEGTLTVDVAASAAQDAAGNDSEDVAESEQQFDTRAPTAVVTNISQISLDTGSSSTDFITNDSSVTVVGTYTGTLSGYEKIQVSAGGAWKDVTLLDESTWSVSGVVLLPGESTTLQTRTIDPAGNVIDGDSQVYTLDTDADVGDDLAVSVSDALVGDAEKGAVAYTVNGLDPDASATVTFSDGTNSVTGVAGVADLSTLVDGPITVSVSATDAAGNTATGAGASTTLDTDADVGDDLAVSVSDALVGDAEKGAVAYTVNGLDPDASATVTFSDGTNSVTGVAGVADLSTLVDGPITVSVSATDAAGNTATGAGASTTLDTDADVGDDLAVSVSDALVGDAEKGAVAYTVNGLDPDASATVTFSDGTNSVTGVAGVADLSTLVDGPITVSVSATDAAGNTATGAGASTTLDTDADVGDDLAVSVSDALVGDAEKGAVAYTVNGLDPDASATVTFSDGTNSVTGVAGVADLSTLVDGPITVSVSATDAAGNTATGAGASTTLDTDADVGDDLAVSVSDALVGDAEKGAVAYTVNGLDPDASATVTFSDGTNSVTGVAGVADLSTLVDGPITVSVSATDAAGNTATGAGASTTLDTDADVGDDLAVSVSDALVGDAEKGAVAYTVNGLDPDASATVTFSDGTNSVTGVAGVADLSTLVDGPITVSVSATDAAGNTATGAGASTTLDTDADVGDDLAVSVSDALVGDAEKGAVAYTVNGLDPDASATVTFSDGTNSVTGVAGVADLSTLVDGPITVSVSATDAAGNTATGAGASTTLDTDADVGDDLAVSVSDALVGDAEKGAVAYTVNGLDPDASATVTFSDGTNSVTGVAGVADLSTLVDGPITVSVSATDAAGNTATGAGASTTLDTDADVGDDLAVSVSDALVGDAEKGAVAYTVNGLDPDASATVTFSDGTNSVTGVAGVADLSTLVDGPITVSVSATDAAGNTATGAGASTTLDTDADVGDDLAVSVSDALVGDAEKGAVAYTVNGLDPDASATVTFSDGTNSVTGVAGVADLSTLVDGPITVSVSATDAAGNTATGAGASTTLDTDADVGDDLAVSVSDALVGDAEKGAVAYTVNGLDPDASATVTFSDGTNSVTGVAGVADLSTLVDGPITVSVSATDAAGNTATGAGASTTLDTDADVGDDLAVSVSDALVGDAEKGAVAYTVNGLDPDASATVTFSDGTNSVTGVAGVADLSTLVDGPITVSVSATDAAGNTATGAGASTTLDTDADVGDDLAVSVSDALVGDAEKGAVAYTVNGLDPDASATVTFSDGTNSVTGVAGVADLSTLVDGPITVSVSATDAAGNTATGAGASTTLDTDADVGDDLAVSVSDALVGDAEKGAVAYTVNGLDPDASATVTFSDGTNSVTGVAGVADLSTLVDGPITVSVSATDAAGNTATGAGASTTLDTDADVGDDLAVSVSDALVGDAEKGAVAYTVNGLDPDASATVTFSDGTNSVTGVAGVADLSTLVDGPITVSVSATDAAGNTATGAGASTTLDTDADVGDDLAVSVSDALVGDAEKGAVAYTVNGLDPDASATVTFSDGTNSVTGVAGVADLSTLVDGPITVSVSATDAAGNTATGAGASTTLDTDADVGDDLAVSVSDALVGDAEKGAVAYTVNGLDPDASATVTFSDGTNSVTGVAGVADLSTLVDGPITVSVSATDAAGNTATGAGASTTLDTDADVGDDLAVSVSDALVGDAEKGAVAYTVNGLDPDASATVTFSDGTNSVTGVAGVADLSTLVDGPITVSVSATDAAGNTATGAGASTTLDTDADVGDDLAVSVSDALVGDAEKGAVAYTVNGLDPDASATVTFSDGTNSVTGVAGVADLSTLVDGPITVSVSATDAAGNTATGAGASTTLDTDADVGDDLAVSVSDALVGDAEKGAVAYTVNGLDPDASATVTFSDGTNSVTGVAGVADLSTLVDGPITVSVSATDAAGNTATGAGASTTLDTDADVGDDLAVSVSDALVGDAEKGAVAYTVNGLDPDASATVTFSDGTNSVTGVAGVADLSTLVDGPITVSVSATDAAGNTATGAGASTTLDTDADVGDDLAVSVSDALVGDAEKGAVAYTVNGLDPDASATVTFSDGTNSVTGVAGVADLSTLVDGPITVSVSATDAAGNTATGAGASTTLDTAAPGAAVTFITQMVNDSGTTGDFITNDNVVDVSGSFSGALGVGESIQVSVDNWATWVTASVPFDDFWVAEGVQLDEGTHTLQTRTIDLAGNITVGASQVYTLDTMAYASISLDDITADNVVNIAEAGGTVAVTGSVGGEVEDGDIVTLTVNGNDYFGTVNGNAFSIDVDGADLAADTNVHASVTTTDTAGNSATATDDQAYSVDTSIAASINLNAITADNVVNIAEAGGMVAVTGSVGDDVQDGDTVALTVNSATYTGTVSSGASSASDVDGANLAADTNVHASVTTTDLAGNSATATDDQAYSVDTAIAASISLNAITADTRGEHRRGRQHLGRHRLRGRTTSWMATPSP